MTKKAWHQKFKRSAPERRTFIDGTTFHSRGEMLRWHTLRLWLVAGHIKNLRRQVAFPLIHEKTGIAVLTEKGRIAVYTADFVYEKKIPGENLGTVGSYPLSRNDTWEQVIEDYKGYSSRESKFRISVFEALYGCKVKIVTK